MKVTRVGIVGAVLLVGVVVVVLMQSMSASAVSCEVCMEYGGRSQCRTVAGADRELAREGARTNACAFLSSGVTDSMACGRAKPASVKCW